MANQVKTINQFKGMKNDEDPKQVSWEFLTSGININYPDTGILGLSKILMPEQVNTLTTGATAIDGLYEYRYLNSSNALATEYIGVTGGKILKNVLTSGTLLTTAVITTGLCSFVTYRDKCYIANGKDYVHVYNGSLGIVSQMGAPFAKVNASTGLVTSGVHFYAQSYVTSGGEEVIGSVSNSITTTSASKTVTLTLPLGYSGVTSRKIYRTTAGSTALKLLTTIADNSTTTYTDDIADATITTGTTMPSANNELPKPYFLAVANQSLFGAVDDKYPTQVFKTDANYEVWDTANYIDVSNYSPDNTPLKGIGIEFGKVVVGSERNVYLLEASDTIVNAETVKPTRAYVGMKSGYTVKQVPSNIDFPSGGLIFVSSLNDVRMITGVDDIPVVTVLGNISTQNWAQNIRGTLNDDLKSYTNIYSEYYDNKYHLVIDGVKYVLDLRTRGWTKHEIASATYTSSPRVLSVLNNLLYNGQTSGVIEKEYSGIQYRSESVPAVMESPYIAADSYYKNVVCMKFWFSAPNASQVDVRVEVDDDIINPITGSFEVQGGYFDSNYFNSTYFKTTDTPVMDFKTININAPCRWLKYKITNTTGRVSLQRVDIVGEPLEA